MTLHRFCRATRLPNIEDDFFNAVPSQKNTIIMIKEISQESSLHNDPATSKEPTGKSKQVLCKDVAGSRSYYKQDIIFDVMFKHFLCLV